MVAPPRVGWDEWLIAFILLSQLSALIGPATCSERDIRRLVAYVIRRGRNALRRDSP